MKFIIFHGSFGTPESNWFPKLKEKLEAIGQEVLVPQFPIDDWNTLTTAGANHAKVHHQTLENWIKAFSKVKKNLKKSDKLCFVGHSLGPLFTLHLVDRFNLKLDSAIFVAPFLDLPRTKGAWQIHRVNQSFYKTNFDFPKLKKLIPTSYVVYGDNDPYVPTTAALEFASKLGSSPIVVNRAGHLNSEVNVNELPLVYELCKSRLNLSLYQKYVEHRHELFSVDYFKGKTEEVIYLKPKDVFDEGVFPTSEI